ncbi:MAG: GH25 family lysozyme [Pseudomonadota bacterium]
MGFNKTSALAIVLGATLLAGCTTSSLESLSEGIKSTPKFGDSDPVDIEGGSPRNYAVHGVDVAKYQNTIDWPRARTAGVSFAFIKATEGGDLLDDRFAQNWAAAKRAQIPRGAYHFYYFCTPAATQARWFIQNVPKEKNALPPVLDMEWNHLSPTCKKRPPRETVLSEMRIFLSMIERHYGKRPIIYTTPDFYRQNIAGAMTRYQMWLRGVKKHPSIIYPNRRWVFWQYSGTGRANGFDGDVDLNVFHGSKSAWREWLKKNAS